MDYLFFLVVSFFFFFLGEAGDYFLLWKMLQDKKKWNLWQFLVAFAKMCLGEFWFSVGKICSGINISKKQKWSLFENLIDFNQRHSCLHLLPIIFSSLLKYFIKLVSIERILLPVYEYFAKNYKMILIYIHRSNYFIPTPNSLEQFFIFFLQWKIY